MTKVTDVTDACVEIFTFGGDDVVTEQQQQRKVVERTNETLPGSSLSCSYTYSSWISIVFVIE